MQDRVDGLNEYFLKAVSRGRGQAIGGLDKVRKIADGRVWLAEKARELGLIDDVQRLDETARKLRAEIRKRRSSKIRSEELRAGDLMRVDAESEIE
jgi:protease-4